MTTPDHGAVRGAIDCGAPLFWSEERWRSLQQERLAAHVAHAVQTPFYRSLGIDPSTPLKSLPLTSKDDLAKAGADAWALSPGEVAEWVCTSGTLGKPLDVPLTARDLRRLAENEAVALSLAGIRRGDLLLLAVGMERMFVAGLAYWLGAQQIGAACVRVGPQIAADPRMLADLIARLRPAGKVFLIAVPSFLTQVERPAVPLAGVVAIGEPVRNDRLDSNELARRVTDRLGCPVMSTYALTETCTTFAEGPGCRGGHLNPALAVVEVIDENGAAVAEGAAGEVVITPLGVEGMPLIRFRTGDIATLHTGVCGCGRTTPRLGPILGRKQQLLKIRGTSVFPNAIVETVRGTEGVVDCVVVAEREAELSDRVMVFVHAREEGVRVPIENRLRAALRVTPAVHFVGEEELRSMSSGTRKLRRFVDRR